MINSIFTPLAAGFLIVGMLACFSNKPLSAAVLFFGAWVAGWIADRSCYWKNKENETTWKND